MGAWLCVLIAVGADSVPARGAPASGAAVKDTALKDTERPVVIGGARVSVVSASVGPVTAENIQGKQVTESDLLMLTVRIECIDENRKINYRSWRPEVSRKTGGALRDNVGNSYAALPFYLTKIPGSSDERTIFADQPLTDVLIFERPVNRKVDLTLTLRGKNVSQEDKTATLTIPAKTIDWTDEKVTTERLEKNTK